MLGIIIILLLIIWAAGFVGGFALNGFIHIFLLIALILIVIRLLQGKRV